MEKFVRQVLYKKTNTYQTTASKEKAYSMYLQNKYYEISFMLDLRVSMEYIVF